MDLAKKIIHLFLHHPMPEKARMMFQQWCLEENNADHKEKLLEEEWNRLDPASVLDTAPRAYEQKLRKLHDKMGVDSRKTSLRTIWIRLRPVAAAAVILLAVAANIIIVRNQIDRKTTTTFITAENGKGRFSLPDNSVVWLNADSKVTFARDFTRADHRYIQLHGEAFFNVRKDSLRPFIVELGDLQVKVLGTRFNACNFEAFGSKEVTLLSGSVEIISNQLREPLRLAPNETCIYDTQTRQFMVKQVTASNYCNWLNDAIVFQDTPLADILTDLEHRYNIRFQVDPDVDTSIGLSFTLDAEKLENTLDLTTKLANLKYRRINKHYIRIYR